MHTLRYEGSRSDRRAALARRGLDIALSSTLLLLTLPVLLVVAVGAALSLRAWPIFSQQRVGKDGAHFRFLKVRTLPRCTPAYIDKYQLDLWRIPAFCRLVRRLHLDELPQLLLVLRGEMSLVGPRPEMACLHDRMDPAFAMLRTSVRPGCTGLWQLSEANTGLIADAPQYDRTYLTRRTLRLDLWLLGRTTLRMIGLGRRIQLDDLPRWVGAVDHVSEVITLPGTSVALGDVQRPDTPASRVTALGAGR